MNIYRSLIIIISSIASVLVVILFSALLLMTVDTPHTNNGTTFTLYLPYIAKAPDFPLDYGPYRAGQQPGGSVPSPAQINEDMAILEPRTKLIRTYGSCFNELAAIPGIARNHGIDVYQGVNLNSEASTNNQELGCYAELLQDNENIRAGVIGGEVLLFNVLTETQLITYINQAKQMGNVPVTTGEAWNVWCNQNPANPASGECRGRPDLGEAVDFILMHVHPYWEGIPVEHGAAHVVASYITLRGVYKNRNVVIGETGWPTCPDEMNDKAVAGVGQQHQFIQDLWYWSNLYHIQVLYFEGFDEDWKAISGPLVERCWGLYTANRAPKHNNLDWSVPTPIPEPITPSVRIEYPKDNITTTTENNCAIPIFGKAYNTEPGWYVKVEVFTDAWYLQDKWYQDGKIPIIDNMWSLPEIFLANSQSTMHKIRARLFDATDNERDTHLLANIIRGDNCSP